MITYRYSEYSPDDDSEWSLERLMSMVSELIMQNDLKLEDALRSLLNQGLPVNLFLKEGGMEDLITNFSDQLQNQIDQILKTFHLEQALLETRSEALDLLEKIKKELEKIKRKDRPRELIQKLSLLSSQSSIDDILRIKREFSAIDLPGGNSTIFLSFYYTYEDLVTIRDGNNRYQFTGSQAVTRSEALKLLKELDALEKLIRQLREAIENGNLFSFNLEQLARYLGPESYQEFIERREHILKSLAELLEKEGMVVENSNSGELQLSSQSIQRIGRRALESIFSNLKSDAGNGRHETNETGDSENLTSTTRSMEYGDPIANLDIASSVINAIINRGVTRPRFNEIEIYEGRGRASSATVVLLDMSGSMSRDNRFYNAKKVTMALDSLIRSEFGNERLVVIGFGTMATEYSLASLPGLQPFPVTIFSPSIRMKIDLMEVDDEVRKTIPAYFTNLQSGLQLSRKLLGSRETKNKQIILITDGVPTAHNEQSVLHINYPPTPADFHSALREVKLCCDDGIIINTFLLTSDWDIGFFDDEPFIKQFAKYSQGRIFYPHPDELNKLVLFDFIANKKKLLDY